MLFIHSDQIDPHRYLDILKTVQTYSPNLAIIIPKYFMNIPLPDKMDQLPQIQNEIISKYNLGKDKKCHYSGHNYGQFLIQS